MLIGQIFAACGDKEVDVDKAIQIDRYRKAAKVMVFRTVTEHKFLFYLKEKVPSSSTNV